MKNRTTILNPINALLPRKRLLGLAATYFLLLCDSFSSDALVVNEAGDISIGGLFTPNVTLTVNGQMMSTGSGLGIEAAIPSKGAYLDWNRQLSGITYLINQRGEGSGGFSFYNATKEGVLGNPIFTLGENGEVTTGGTLKVNGATTIESGPLTVNGTSQLNGDTTIASGNLTINGSEGNMTFTSLHIPTGSSKLQASIDFGKGVGLRLNTTTYNGSPINDTFSFYAPGDTDGFVHLTPTPLGAHISSPVKDKWLHLSSNGKGISISKDGAPVESPNTKAALHVDGKIAHLGLLKLSDRNAKTNISLIYNGLKSILALSGVRYNWNATDSGPLNQELGFVAQEVEDIIPEAVHKDKDGTRYMDYDSLVPLLVEAIKEQHATIEKLESRIQSIENQPKFHE